MQLEIYDTLAKKVRAFEPLEDNLIKMYVCGPTVYDHAHLGHARSAIAFDFIRRVFEYFGYQVYYVSNYTDIDDKMIDRANKRKISIKELADEIIQSYEDDMAVLSVRPPTLRPKATEHINDMLSMVDKLINDGFAYAVEDGVYFRVHKAANYGALSNFKLADSSTEDKSVGNKENAADFALLKLSKEHEPYWETKWGKMRPGWHIECSAMSNKYLGATFDIHGGGQDLAFPHHTNEIAQSECYSGQPFVRYWMHNGFLTIDKEKMSKSIGNFFTIKDILAQGFSGDDIRWFILQAHYRKPLEFNLDLLREAQQQVNRISVAVDGLLTLATKKGNVVTDPLIQKFVMDVFEIETQFKEALRVDINGPKAVAEFLQVIKLINSFVRENIDLQGSVIEDAVERVQRMLDVLGILQFRENTSADLGGLMDLVIELRATARANKDWATSDKIRDELKAQNIVLEDIQNGTIWKRV